MPPQTNRGKDILTPGPEQWCAYVYGVVKQKSYSCEQSEDKNPIAQESQEQRLKQHRISHGPISSFKVYCRLES